MGYMGILFLYTPKPYSIYLRGALDEAGSRYADQMQPLLDAGMSFWWNDEATFSEHRCLSNGSLHVTDVGHPESICIQ